MRWLKQMRLNWLEHAVAHLRRAVNGRRGPSQPEHLATGIEGEAAAYFYLRRKGYTVVARRWGSKHQRGDLDLIAWNGPLLCVVEVKTRTAHDMAAAEVAVDAHKRTVLRKLARMYVRQLPAKISPPVRFDVLSIYLIPGRAKEFVHFEAAFGWSERAEYELR